MPYLLVRTNQTVAEEQLPQIMSKLSASTAQSIGKSERYVMVSLEHGQNMVFAGDDSPCAYLEMKSIGLPADKTTELSGHLCQLIQAELQIPQDRIYIEFADAARHMWGWNGATF